jgi:hypothetical protein
MLAYALSPPYLGFAVYSMESACMLGVLEEPLPAVGTGILNLEPVLDARFPHDPVAARKSDGLFSSHESVYTGAKVDVADVTHAVVRAEFSEYHTLQLVADELPFQRQVLLNVSRDWKVHPIKITQVS